MQKIGACFAIGALAAITLSTAPVAAQALSLGPLHFSLPFFGHRYGLVRHRRFAARHRKTDFYDKASLPGTATAQRAEAALFYPALALPDLYDEVFWPDRDARWPFGYEAIFRSAFAKSPLDEDASACRQTVRVSALLRRLRTELRPRPDQLALLQKLAGALTMTSESLVKACPRQIPAQPTARLSLMQSQIETLSMAIDLVRSPLQLFEQSLDAAQKARFAARSAAAMDCGAVPAAITWSIDEIDQSVQPGDAQRQAMAELQQAFASAAADLHAHCANALPPTPLARLQAIESRLDASWRAALSMQVALARFERTLDAAQRQRFQAMNLAQSR